MPTENDSQRRELLAAAYHNTRSLPCERVDLDLSTDSWAELAGERPVFSAQAESHAAAAGLFRALHGCAFSEAVAGGRLADAIVAAVLARPGALVLHNGLFPSARFHLTSRGAEPVDLGLSAPVDSFAGDLNVDALEAFLAGHPRRPVACVWLEATTNALGGPPLSPENLRRVHRACAAREVPVVLDMTRLWENVVMIQEEGRGGDGDARELARTLCRLADVCTMSAVKNYRLPYGGFVAANPPALISRLRDQLFVTGTGLTDGQRALIAAGLEAEDPLALARARRGLVRWLRQELLAAGVPLAGAPGGHAVLIDAAALLSHLGPHDHPVQVLSAALYRMLGARGSEHHLSDRQRAAGMHLLRLAVPTGRYTSSDLAPLVSALAAIRAAPGVIPGLRRTTTDSGVLATLYARYQSASDLPTAAETSPSPSPGPSGPLEPAPFERLLRLAMGKLIAKPLYVAARLGLADRLADGPRSVDELARSTETDAPSLFRLLRTLASVGVFAGRPDGRFELTREARYLLSGPDGFRSWVLWVNDPRHDRIWDNLLHSVRTGGSAIEKTYGLPLFQWLSQEPDLAQVFNEGMTNFVHNMHAAAVQAYDFSRFPAIVDVGGGHGALMSAILSAYPGPRGLVFDQPAVIEGTCERLARAGLADRCAAMAGDFFEAVPAGADAYLMSFILHDWDDDRAVSILENCRRAMTAPGAATGERRLLVVEIVLPEGNHPSLGKLTDLGMLVMTGGRERTAGEYRALLARGGFSLSRIIPTAAPVSVIEGVLADSSRVPS